MAELFHAHKALQLTPPCYFIESTAPNNVDDGPAGSLDLKKAGLERRLAPIEADKAVAEIGAHLAKAETPNLVVMVHGFNNPELAALGLYKVAAEAAASDVAIKARQGLVCIGYRWPSERISEPWSSTRKALPALPGLILRFGGLLVLFFVIAYLVSVFLGFGSTWWESGLWHLFVIASLAGIGIVFVGMLLRAIVYFRDGYRAVNYGVPDLIEVIRQIDDKVHSLRGGVAGKRAELSFVGHSMGAFVVTNAIRALTNLFAAGTLRASLNSGTVTDPAAPVEEVNPEIGNVFTLKRFVLASPDIPAETLMSNRANFLEPSLRRFEEAYLFSNEGDEVLRLISTTANYFSFPTTSSTFGYRLGNVEILKTGYGILDPHPEGFLHSLRVGPNTLHKLYKQLRDAGLPRGQKRRATEDGAQASYQPNLARVFTYFDCTDYVDASGDGKSARGLLTYALQRKAKDPKAKLGFWNHARLLLHYGRGGPNVHGGYFEGELCRQLIFRLACLGCAETLKSFAGPEKFSAACADKQIKVLVSPRLAEMFATAPASSAALATTAVSAPAASIMPG